MVPYSREIVEAAATAQVAHAATLAAAYAKAEADGYYSEDDAETVADAMDLAAQLVRLRFQWYQPKEQKAGWDALVNSDPESESSLCQYSEEALAPTLLNEG